MEIHLNSSVPKTAVTAGPAFPGGVGTLLNGPGSHRLPVGVVAFVFVARREVEDHVRPESSGKTDVHRQTEIRETVAARHGVGRSPAHRALTVIEAVGAVKEPSRQQ